MSGQFILGQYVRIIGRPELLTIGAIRDGLLFIGDRCAACVAMEMERGR